MVKASEISTVARFDLVSETPAKLEQGTPHIRVSASETGHSVASRPYAHRNARTWEIQVATASRAELWRLRELWDLTAQGTLPMLWSPPQGGDDVAVIFADEELAWRLSSHTSGAFLVRLREWYG